MAINLVTQFQPYVDEIFTKESKKELVTNQDFDWTGAHTIKVYKISTGTMNDYDRAGTGSGAKGSRYGAVQSLDATTEEFTLKKDRSFTFAIDKLDTDETAQQLAGASALARQQREVVIPEVDSYVYGVIAAGAGTKPAAVALTPENIYDIVMETDVDTQLRKQGVVSNLDGASVIKVPATRLPENCGFIMCHPCATVAPTKLEDYKIHQDPPGISGSLVEGRICYDAFVLDNKKMAIYYQELAKA